MTDYDLGIKHGREQSLDEQYKEIERLGKEKEWLLNDNAQAEYWNSDRTTVEKCRERIITRMQQALEENKNVDIKSEL